MKVLILTAAVEPDVRGKMTITSPDERLAQYQSAIRAWVEAVDSLGVEVAVVETTGFGAMRLASAAGVSVIPLDFVPGDAQRSGGKGAVEAAAIDFGISQIATVEYFVKATGRIFPSNARYILSNLTRATPACCLRMIYAQPFVDTRLFAMHHSVWEGSFTKMAQEVDDERGVYLEHVMARRAHAYMAEGVPIERLPQRPAWTGRSGSTGQEYGRGFLAPARQHLEVLFETAAFTLLKKKAF